MTVEPPRTETLPVVAAAPDGRDLPGKPSWRPVAVAAGAAAVLLLAWQALTTVGRWFPGDSTVYLLNAWYLDHHHALAPAYVSYEYPAPPLYQLVTIALDHLVRAVPSWPVELSSNPATRLAWLLLVVGSAACLTTGRTSWRRAGIAGLGVAVLWALDEAISLGKSENWSSGQLVSLASAAGLVLVTALLAREVWPDHAARAVAAAGFVMAYPVVLRYAVVFHPETTMAFLTALALLLALRGERRGWPLPLGVGLGIVIGLDIDTRQSAAVVAVCVVLFVLVVGRRRARRFLLGTLGAAVLVGGPWLGYAAYTWGNPLQSTLYRTGGMLEGGEPRSFYVSFPFPALVTHPYRDDFSNQLLPKLHADLWTDWYGQFHLNGWKGSTQLDHRTATSQSVLGFVGDALALGGLAAIGIPALVRVARRRGRRDSDTPLALLALVATASLAGFVAQIMRFPQITGVEIKASYLLFTAPCFAVFSVAAWLAVARWRRRAGIVLAAVAVAYLFSYGTSLASTLSKHYDPQAGIEPTYGYVDLRLALRSNVIGRSIGSEVDYEASITNAGTMTAGNVVLDVDLPAGMSLLGPPYYERGAGCTGTSTIECRLDFLPNGMSTPVRFGVRLTQPGAQTLTARVSAYELDATPRSNVAVSTIVVAGA